VSKFIEIEGQNIRVSNIKHFGISYENTERDWEFDDFFHHDGFLNTTIGCAKSLVAFSLSVAGATPKVKTSRPYLYVTTYQGDNYIFRAELEELENYQNMIKGACA